MLLSKDNMSWHNAVPQAAIHASGIYIEFSLQSCMLIDGNVVKGTDGALSASTPHLAYYKLPDGGYRLGTGCMLIDAIVLNAAMLCIP